MWLWIWKYKTLLVFGRVRVQGYGAGARILRGSWIGGEGGVGGVFAHLLFQCSRLYLAADVLQPETCRGPSVWVWIMVEWCSLLCSSAGSHGQLMVRCSAARGPGGPAFVCQLAPPCLLSSMLRLAGKGSFQAGRQEAQGAGWLWSWQGELMLIWVLTPPLFASSAAAPFAPGLRLTLARHKLMPLTALIAAKIYKSWLVLAKASLMRDAL